MKQSIDLFNPTIPETPGEILSWVNLHGACVGLAISSAIAKSKKPFLIIAPDNLSVSHLIEQLQFFGTEKEKILHFPDRETLPYDHFSPHQDIISERLAVLHHLSTRHEGAVITPISTLLHYLPPKNFLDGHQFMLRIGDQLNIDVLRTRLVNAGYHVVSQVREHGEFAIRGSIIDLFPMGSKHPFRIDLLDEEIDSIRIFSPENQRTLEKINEIRLLPAKEFPLTEDAIELFRTQWREQFPGNPLQSPIYQDISEGIYSAGIEYYLPLFFQQTANLFDYTPEDISLILLGDLETKVNEFWHEIAMRYELGKHDITHPLLPPEKLFISLESFNAAVKNYARIKINAHHPKNICDFNTSAAPQLQINHKIAQPLVSLQEYLANYSGRILFCAETLGRREVLLQLFKTIDLHPLYFPSWQNFLTSKEKYGIAVTALEEGCSLENPKITLIAETQLFNQRVMQRRLRKPSIQDTDTLIKDLTELQIGDPIVHLDHGIGYYRGLETLTVGGQANEFLSLEYQGGDKLYVPVTSLHLVSRYTGSSPDVIIINKLGTEQWQKTKRKATEKIRDVAAELLDLYAKRAAKPGHAYQFPEEQYATFSATFPFEETPDQLQAIEQVIADMTSEKPMDRVICGDVGFGKTEVSLRAAFISVLNSKQVVVLVPTTLLAQQHFQTFQDRFADWPVQIEMLSRFRTGKEQKNILQRLEDGKVDIVIGTHKLLQDEIKLKSLGLIIIDEEHRFGVKQKEKLKSLRTFVDILTLTATPIPRTLNMTLAGLRDLSIIATPPARRLSIKTFVHEYENHLIKEAIQREILRGGQVYFLHNEVSTINKKAEDISQLVPESRPIVAHGQMHERDLEKVMTEFYHRHFNVLVCSTIIESGIDIPTANTIIINRADKFGIAQLHQLRGRVGRSHHQAYAYLFIPSRKYISADAVKRLEAITTFDELGIGFTLATHDLEIRGAGELLGEEQSGDMQALGFTLYMDLLSRAVDALKTGKKLEDQSLTATRCEVDLHLPALIPDKYLSDVQLRLQFYNRIANTKNVAELDEIQVEMIDRFGLLPEPLKNLIAVAELRQQAETLGILKIDAGEKGGKIEFNDQPNIKPETIIHLIQTQSNSFRLDGPKRLKFNLNAHETNQRIELVKQVLAKLA